MSKKKKLCLIISIAVLLVAALVVGIYFLFNRGSEPKLVSESGDIFYRNDLLTVGADPDVIYISEGEDAGYYYMYITSDDLHGSGFLAYKSRDLVEWVCAGVALRSEGTFDEATGYTTVSYAFSNYWAPEVIYDRQTKLYYMFYTANRYDTSFQSTLNFYGDIAVSESPAGPFVQYNKYIGKEPVVVDEEKKILTYEPVFDFAKMDVSHPLYEAENDGYMKVIDMNPFVDPQTGKKYVYFCHDLGKQQAVSESSIYVMALGDDYSPDYSQMEALTTANCLELDGDQDMTMNEGSTNEAPYVIYNEQSGKYYLLYSVNAYYQKTYSVRVAVGDSPMGPFRKLTRDQGGFLLYADSHWTWASGTGHCSVVNRDGQDYIVYHAHLDRVNGNSKRGIAMDTLNWVENGDGLLVPVANGPSAALMPLTTYLYENVADKATVKAENLSSGKASALTDGIILHRESAFLQDATFDGDSATIELEFKSPETISAIAVYNSYDYDYMYSQIDSIRLHLAEGGYKLYKDLSFDWDTYYTEEGYAVPGGSIAIEFDPVEVSSIEISMPKADAKYAVSEIAVMARRQDREELADIPSDTSWAVEAPADDTVEFDGVVDPAEYKGDKIAFADTNGVTMTMYSKMAEEGIFFGFKSNDTRVFVNPEHAIFQNSSVEIQLGVGGTEELNANVIQLRYGLDGSVEGWIGVDSTETYDYMRTYIETVSKVHINGELNSSDCDGYDVEIYVPYKALNLSEKPESLICAPSFNTRKDYDASGRTTWTLMVGSSFQDPTSWYRIDANGQTVMTDGFRVQDDQITQTGGSNQFYYFDDELADAYYVNVDIQVQDILNGDRFPKFGVVSKSLDSLLGYYFDYAGGNVNSIGRIGAKTTEFTGTQWQWETNSSKTFGVNPCVSLTGERKVNVELIRYENQLVMLVNGRFVMSDVDVKGLENGSIPGLFFFNTTANITVNAYETNKQLVKLYMGGFQPEIAIDGDLGDWAAKTELASEKDAASGNEMTVYGYQTPAGVYLAYEVKHGYQPKVYMWNEGKDDRGVWYYNTNAEFWINDTHFAATAFGDSGFMVKSMVTTEDLVAGNFTTVVEVFVPREVVGNTDAAVGFAFKTCDQDYSKPAQVTDPKMKFRGDPWWYFNGRFPTDMAKRFVLNRVTETTKPSKQEGSYAVKVLPTANGVVTLHTAEAKAGDKIRLTVTPKKGYQLISLTANGKPCGQELDMPGEDLYIVARFGLPFVKNPTQQPKVYPQGTFFGSAGNYHSSDVLNMSTDKGKNPYLVMDSAKGTPLYAYVKGVTAKQFYLEMTVKVTGIRADEKYPKFGLMTNDGREMVKFYLDMSREKLVGGIGAVHQKSGKGDDWAGQTLWNLNKKLDLSKDSVKLGLLRDGNRYYYYVNGQLVACGNDLSSREAAMGIFSFGTSLKVSNYRLVKSGSQLNNLLEKALSDMRVFRGATLSENFFTQTQKGVYTLSTDSDAQHKVDDVISAGQIMRQSYYSLAGKLTLTNADMWGQARILISADPKNEYFIALEKVSEEQYQIFTMSKANEDGWNDWRLIEIADLNGNRNAIDFEVVVNGNQLYFLIDGEVCYTSNRVPMDKSTVKFTGYNVGTTTVEDLSLKVFASSKAAQQYIAGKPVKDYETRFQSRMDSLYNEYIVEHDCAGKGGTLIFGDSNMDFWGSWEQQTGLAKYLNGYNVGIGGSTVADWLYAYDQLIQPFNADRFVILVGGNDVNVWGDDGETVVENLRTLFAKLHADHPDAEIYYIYTTPSPSAYSGGVYTPDKLGALVKGAKALCESLDYVQGIDMFDLMTTEDKKNSNESLFAEDKLHMSEAGYKVFSDHLYERIFRGENFGAAQDYKTSNGVDLSGDVGEDPVISVFGGAPQYAYVHDVFTEKFSFETEINVSKVLNNDGYPKFGLLVNGQSEMVKFFVDMNPAMTATHVGVVYQPTGGGDDWGGSQSRAVPGMAFTGENTVKLKLVREGRAYYFYVNDTLVMYNAEGFRAEQGAVGIFSFNSALTASKYSILTDAQADTAIAKAKEDMKELTKPGLTCNWFADKGDGKFTLTTNSSAEHKVDDLTQGGQVLRSKYYSVKGKLTLTNAGNWGQARILISADPKNEYFIALEKTDTGKYQIFTMSKSNQNGWDRWELILHQDVNAYRNAIDFEVLVIGNKLYFLIEDQVVYTSTRVPMTESTVKFTGYNNATTTVEDLSAEVFASKQEAESYLADKSI